MTSRFFITGLPQSRTAWLANLFTAGNVFCFHDLLGEVEGIEGMAARLEGSQGVVGDSDSGLLALYVAVARRWPEAPWVLIERDFEDAWGSLCEFVGAGPWRDKLNCSWELHEAMKREWGRCAPMLINNPRCLTVPYESLERTDMVECIWKHCAPGQRFDRRRAEALQKLSVRPFQAKCAIRPAFNLVTEARKLWPSWQAS